MPADYSPVALAGATGADPWALRRRLASGDPDAIVDAAVGFRRAGGQAADAAEYARVADRHTAAGFVNDGQPVFDGVTSTTRSHALLGDGGEKMELAARAFIDVASALAENTGRAASLVSALDSDVARIVGLRNAYFADSSATLTPPVAAAAEQRYHQMAVEATRSTAARVQAEVDDYEAVLADRTGRLRALGYLAAAGADGHPEPPADPLDEVGEFVDGLGAGVVHTGGAVIAGLDAVGDTIDDAVTNGVNELGNVVGGPVGDVLVGAAGGLDDLGDGADDLIGGVYAGVGDTVGGQTGERPTGISARPSPAMSTIRRSTSRGPAIRATRSSSSSTDTPTTEIRCLVAPPSIRWQRRWPTAFDRNRMLVPSSTIILLMARRSRFTSIDTIRSEVPHSFSISSERPARCPGSLLLLRKFSRKCSSGSRKTSRRCSKRSR
jgi:hypothetical protein